MNIDFINDLIRRLSNAERENADWYNDERVFELGIDSSTSSTTYRVQRLPKLRDHNPRSFLANCSSSDQSVNSGHCICQQLSYSGCLNMVQGRQEKLNWITGNDRSDTEVQTFTDFVHHVIQRLLPCPYVVIDSNDQHRIVNEEYIDHHPNILLPLCIIETGDWFYAVNQQSSNAVEWVTLLDAIVFRPYVIRDDTDRLLFVVYQLISTLAYCHKEANLVVADLRLDAVQIHVDDFWCRLDLWRCLQYVAKSITLNEDSEFRLPLGMWTDRWTRRAISNFEYLNILNEFAGRRLGDAYYHPIFPWICDFTCDVTKNSTGGWRDLTKTKFRLTKGDQQLEQTFIGHQRTAGGSPRNAAPGQGADGRSASISSDAVTSAGISSPPHHVTEFLSDIGYYAYKSRRTPKSVLCRHVRHRWVPEEYPSSLRRLYEWTPDEAVPELYSDPKLFTSIHEDLADLELPAWCVERARESGKTVEQEFIDWHRTQLESDQVSDSLHAWIDLIFGYQLTGQAAVKAKNVQLHLVERVDRLCDNGIVQLFTRPHPRRQKIASTSTVASHADDVMNPLYDMEHLETVHTNTDNTGCHETSAISSALIPTDIWNQIQTSQISRKTCRLVQECLTSLAVFIVELCHSEAFRQLPKYASDQQRVQIAKRAVFNGQSSPLPRCIKSAIEILLTSNLVNTSENLNVSPSVDAWILCPCLILQPLICLVPFPYYLAPLYDCFRRVRSLEMNFADQAESSGYQSVLELAEKRVRDVAKLLPLILPNMSLAGVELLARLTKRSLFMDPYARVLAVWSLWNPLTQALGPDLTERHFMNCLIDMYDVEVPCSTKFLKLYHRTFLLQLCVRLGLERFLENFMQLLVEAVAGERDQRFYEDDDQYWKAITEQNIGPSAVERVVRRQLPNFSASWNRDSVQSSVEANPDIVRMANDSHDDLDSIVQFQLEITDEGSRLDSASSDVDAATTPVDVVSIRSSESGFSMGGGGLSSSLSLSRTEGDEELAKKDQRSKQQSGLCISEVVEESLLWLAHRLGPLLTVRYLTKNLLRMLALCYSTDRLEPTPQSVDVQSTPSWYPVMGDMGAEKVLHCLEEIAMIYGEHIILRHYFTYAGELIAQALKRLTPNMEMAVLACVALIRRTFPYLTHEQLMENLKDHTFIDTLLFPLIRAASSMKVTFSNTASRTTLTWKLAECLYWLGVRVGSENVKTYLFVLVQRLFCTYDILYELDTRSDGAAEMKEIAGVGKSGEWSDAAFVQLKATFTPVLACRMLKAFGILCGKQYLQLSLSNSDLLAKLCADMDLNVGVDTAANMKMENTKSVRTLDENSAEIELVCKKLKNSSRKLKGTWLAYWEYEIGRNPKENHFNFKHMKLQTFVGHTGSVRKICVLDNENSFFSAGHDKTVKLWSLRSTGDGGARSSCHYSYKSHKRPLWDVAFVDSVRLIASVDGSVHIWDPFMGVPIREFEFGDAVLDQHPLQQQVHAATIVEACSTPSSAVMVAGTLPVIRFLDVRQAKWAQEFSLSFQSGSTSAGPVRALCMDPSGADRWVAVGHGLGHVSTIDVRTGRLLGQSKLCETDIFSMAAFDKDQFIVCPFDHPLALVKARDCSLQCRIPGTSDAIVCMTPFYQELVCATQSSRLRFYASINGDAKFTDSKLRADVFNGAITTIRVCELSRLLLLGSSTGNIELLC